MSQEPRFYGHTKTGQAVYEYTLWSPVGVTLKALNYGGIITAIEIPMPTGERENVVLALENLEAYENNPNYIGALIGRYAGRVSTPITIGNNQYDLSANDRGNCLHGGFEGFGKKIWQAQTTKEGEAEVLHLKYMSPNGEEGFPGNLMVHVSYQLWRDGHIQIIYRALSDQDTVITLTQHTYFNLNPSQLDNLDHYLQINADALQEVGINQTPLNSVVSLMDHPITKEQGVSIIEMNRFIKKQFDDDKGLDHPFMLKEAQRFSSDKTGSDFQARLWNPANSLRLTVKTDFPALVVYAGGWLDETVPLKDKRCARAFGGLCLEAQDLPNGPNLQPNGPCFLKKGDLYHRSCRWTFDFT